MGKASAIPEHLYRYSERCTQGAQQMQDWVRAVLTPALRAYEQGGGQRRANPIDQQVAVQVAKAYYTDRDVRKVGIAFHLAGSAGDLPVGRTSHDLPGDRLAGRTYRLDDTALDTAIRHHPRLDAGAALADKLDIQDRDSIKWITQQLDRHKDDPYFCAGFFNSLTPAQLASLLGERPDCSLVGNNEVLIDALASGVITPQTVGNLLRALDRVGRGGTLDLDNAHIQPVERVNFLNALAQNPMAARNFINALTPKQFDDMMRGGDIQSSLRPDNYYELHFKGMLGVLTAVQLTYHDDPAGMAGLMARAADGLKGVDLSRVPKASALLLTFVGTGLGGSMEWPAKSLDPTQLLAWAEAQGKQVDALLAPYLEKLKETNEDILRRDELEKALTVGLVIEFVPYLDKIVNTGVKTVDDAALSVINTYAGEGVQPLIEDMMKRLGMNGEGVTDLKTFTYTTFSRSGKLALLAHLAQQGLLVDQTGTPVWVDPDPEKRLQLISDMVANPKKYRLASYFHFSVEQFTDAFGRAVDFDNKDSKSFPIVYGKEGKD